MGLSHRRVYHRRQERLHAYDDLEVVFPRTREQQAMRNPLAGL
jgi:hypothetical protein